MMASAPALGARGTSCGLGSSSVRTHGNLPRIKCRASSRPFIARPDDWVVPEPSETETRRKDAQGGALTSNTAEPAESLTYTVYSVRFRTGYSRGGGLSEPHAGVMLGLIGENGKFNLKEIPQLHDEHDRLHDLQEICEVVGVEGGANCRDSVMALELINGEEEMAPPHRRFQRGALDEVSFAGPELGRLAAVLVAPSSGTWELDELIVSSSRCHSSQRFVCRQFLGEGRKAEAPAVQLLPVSSDAVLYGDRQLSAEQASRMYRSNMDDYRARRVTQLVANAALIASGSVLTLAVAGPGYSVPFAVGGVEGMAYFWLLARQVDGIASAASASAYPSAQQPSPSGTLGTLIRATETAPFRYAVLLAMLYGFFWALQNVDSPVGDPNAQTAQALLGVLGFLQYKAAVIVTALMPEDMDEKVQELVEDVQDEVQEKLRRGQ